MARVDVSKPALADLDDIWDYIAIQNHSPLAADKLLTDIDKTMRTLADVPDLGAKVDHLAPGCRRFVVRKNYLIYYRKTEGGIQVVRVLHGARFIHPGYFE